MDSGLREVFSEGTFAANGLRAAESLAELHEKRVAFGEGVGVMTKCVREELLNRRVAIAGA